MSHRVEIRDGMNVLVVDTMNRRVDPKTGKPLTARNLNGLAIIHASEIARYYGLDIQDVGHGVNKVLGVWSLVHLNLIGQRVPYNSETTAAGNRIIRDWKIEKDSRGAPFTSEEVLVEENLIIDTDDGMYARVDDVVRYAKANGWTKGGGWPAKRPAPQIDIAAIVAAVIAALGERPTPTGAQEVAPARKARVWTDEEKAAAGERMRLAREAKKAANAA